MAHYRILIVDDQRDVRLLLRTSLETLKLDLEVIDVPSAEEALLILGKEQIDLMVVDVRLPGMSGLELHERAGRRTPTTNLILITGLTDESVKQQIAQAGAAAYFFKPIRVGPFLEQVCKCLGLQVAQESPKEIPAPGDPAMDRLPQADHWEKLSTRLAVQGGWVMDAQRRTLYQWGKLGREMETQPLQSLMMSLLDQDRQQAQASPGLAFPVHHLFTSERSDLWISSLKPGWVLALLLPAGALAEKASGILSELNHLSTNNLPGEVGHENRPVDPQTFIQVTDESNESELSALLGQAIEHGVQPDDLAAFWDRLAQEEQTFQISHGVMSYEEAIRKGLAKGEHFA